MAPPNIPKKRRHYPKQQQQSRVKKPEKSGVIGKKKSVSETITARNRRVSPLLRLPGELRNKIFEYVFSTKTVYVMLRCVDSKTEVIHCATGQRNQRVDWNDFLGPTFVCKQLHAETYLLPFKLNSFTLDRYSNIDMEEWLAGIEQTRRDATDQTRINVGQRMLYSHFLAM